MTQRQESPPEPGAAGEQARLLVTELLGWARAAIELRSAPAPESGEPATATCAGCPICTVVQRLASDPELEQRWGAAAQRWTDAASALLQELVPSVLGHLFGAAASGDAGAADTPRGSDERADTPSPVEQVSVEQISIA